MRRPHRFEAGSKELLMDEERRKRQSPESVLGRTDASGGQVWADLGCGVGYFSIPLARTGPKVVAIDAQREMLDELLSLVGDVGNICPVLADFPPLPLTDSSLDRVLMVNVLHEVENRELIAWEIFRVLRPGGRLFLVDFQKKDTPHGPPVSERLTPEQVESVFSRMRLDSRLDKEDYYQLNFIRP